MNDTDLNEYEMICPVCNGFDQGVYETYFCGDHYCSGHSEPKCRRCKGRGTVLTPQGEDIVQLYKKYK